MALVSSRGRPHDPIAPFKEQVRHMNISEIKKKKKLIIVFFASLASIYSAPRIIKLNKWMGLRTGLTSFYPFCGASSDCGWPEGHAPIFYFVIWCCSGLPGCKIAYLFSVDELKGQVCLRKCVARGAIATPRLTLGERKAMIEEKYKHGWKSVPSSRKKEKKKMSAPSLTLRGSLFIRWQVFAVICQQTMHTKSPFFAFCFIVYFFRFLFPFSSKIDSSLACSLTHCMRKWMNHEGTRTRQCVFFLWERKRERGFL